MIGASPRLLRRWTLILVAGGVLSACASASAQTLNQPTPGPIAAAPGPQLVRAVNFSFQPPTLSVPLGTVVTFRNDDGEAHTFTADGGGFDSGVLPGGQSFRFTFGTAGTFTYHCNLHSSMRGTIAVGGAATPGTQTQAPAPALAGGQPSGEPETDDEAEHHGGKHGDD